jgi:hypothetical protein
MNIGPAYRTWGGSSNRSSESHPAIPGAPINISFRPFTEEWIPPKSMHSINGCWKAAGSATAFSRDPVPGLSGQRSVDLTQEPFFTIEDGRVRGAYYFTHERLLK